MADSLNVFPSMPSGGASTPGTANAFPDPFFDYSSTQMPRSLYDVLRWCFVPGTPVQMADGSLKAIEDVRVGDVVLNRFGEAARVNVASTRPWDDMIVSVETVDGNAAAVESIPDHEHFVVRAPRLKPNRCIYALKPDKIEKVKARDIRVGDYLVAPQAKLEDGEKPAVDPYVAGTYLGDGWVCQRYKGVGGRDDRTWQDTGEHYATRFIFSPEAYESVARVAAAGLKLVPTTDPNSGAAMVYTCHDYALTDDLKALCGRGARTKRLSDCVYGWSRDEVLEFVAGYVDSDGCLIKNGTNTRGVVITSCNRNLLLQVRRLCNAAGMTPTLAGGEIDGGGGLVPEGRYEKYTLFFNWYNMQPLVAHSEKLKKATIGACGKGKTQSVVIKGGVVYRRVRTINEQPYSGSVHNLEIEGEHSYITCDCATSNCEFVWMTNGTYRTACQRIVRYFLTTIELNDIGDDEKVKYKEFLEKQAKMIDTLAYVGDDWICLHGDTKAVTRDGIFTLRELKGKTVDVLSQDGVYRSAEFKSFGRQELLEVEFSDGRTVLATPEHQWVAKNCSGKLTRVPTTQLTEGYRVPRVAAPRPEQNDEFFEGVRHGFTFGDGSIYNRDRKTPRAEATFFGDKDAEMLKHFEGHGGKPVSDEATQSVTIFGLPAHYKQLPFNTCSASYWYGFVCGFLAADGSVDVYGCAILTQKAKATLAAIVDQLPRIGMSAGLLRGHERTSRFERRDGRVDVYTGIMHYVTLLKQYMLPQDFLLSKHRVNFEQNYSPTNYGEFIGIRDVRETGIVDEVFCCVEEETNTFAIEGGILTGNCYGNAFVSVRIPFRRHLRCPKCHQERALKHINYSFQNWSFIATCSNCNYKGKFERIDRRSIEQDKIKLIRWSPHEMRMLHHPISHNTVYYWIPTANFKREIRKGNKFYIESTPWEIIEAIKKDQWFKFNPDIIYHMKEETLAGIRNAGWGIPRLMANFKQAWYVQVLKRYNEAIGLDYIIPFRVITPAKGPGSGESDPLLHMNIGSFNSKVMGMIRKHRRDPATWNALPFPIQYQALGGEGKDLAPHELITQGVDDMLNAMGFPAEMFKGTLQVQAAPMALRLFERTWTHYVSAQNGLIDWFFEAVTDLLSWERAEGRLQPVTLAEDIEKKQIQLQLAAAQQISKQTAYAPFGIDWRAEVERQFDEEKYYQDATARFQKEQARAQEMEQTFEQADQAVAQPPGGAPMDPAAMAAGGGAPAAAGGMPPGGAPPGGAPAGGAPAGGIALPAGGAGTTPQDMLAQAEQIALQLLGTPYESRKSEMLKIKKADETLHALVVQKIEDIRQKAKQQGGFQALQSMVGGQAS